MLHYNMVIVCLLLSFCAHSILHSEHRSHHTIEPSLQQYRHIGTVNSQKSLRLEDVVFDMFGTINSGVAIATLLWDLCSGKNKKSTEVAHDPTKQQRDDAVVPGRSTQYSNESCATSTERQTKVPECIAVAQTIILPARNVQDFRNIERAQQTLTRSREAIANTLPNTKEDAPLELFYAADYMLQAADEALECGDIASYHRQYDRLTAAIQTALDPQVKHAYHYNVTSNTHAMVSNYIAPSSFENYFGDALSARVHGDGVALLNYTSDWYAHHSHLTQAKEAVSLISYMADSGRVAVHGGDHRIGAVMMDIGYGVFDGVCNGIKMLAMEIIEHPVHFALDLAIMTMLPSLAIAKMAVHFYVNGDQFLAAWKGARHLFTTGDARAIATGISAMVTQGIASHLIFKGAGRLGAKVASIPKTTWYMQQALEKTKEVAKSSVGVVRNIEHQVRAMLELACKHGMAELKEVLATISANPQMFPVYEISAPVLKALIEFKGKMPPVDWRHLLKGEFIGDTLKGLHSRWLKKNIQIVEYIKPRNQHGCYKAVYEIDGARKISSFFPDDWNIATLLEKLQEAYANPVKLGDAMLIGKTQEGILIKFCFTTQNELAKGKRFCITSVYPFLEQL